MTWLLFGRLKGKYATTSHNRKQVFVLAPSMNGYATDSGRALRLP